MSVSRVFSLVVCILFLGLAPCFLGGCGGGVMYAPMDPIPAGKGVLYVYHPRMCQSPYSGTCEVLINNQGFCQLTSWNYVPILCAPGVYKVGAGWAEEVSNIDVQVEAGKASYVSLLCEYHETGLGFGPKYATYEVKKVDEASAKEKIVDCSMTTLVTPMTAEFWTKPVAGVNVSELKTMYVVNEDGKADTTPSIVEELKSRGVTVKSGKLTDMPADTACVVKADENWMWDMGTYVLGLEIKFTKPKTQAVMADAYIKRAMPEGRRGSKIMSHEVINAIYYGTTTVKGAEIAPPPAPAAAPAGK
jgi:hypothetical protein